MFLYFISVFVVNFLFFIDKNNNNGTVSKLSKFYLYLPVLISVRYRVYCPHFNYVYQA